MPAAASRPLHGADMERVIGIGSAFVLAGAAR